MGLAEGCPGGRRSGSPLPKHAPPRGWQRDAQVLDRREGGGASTLRHGVGRGMPAVVFNPFSLFVIKYLLSHENFKLEPKLEAGLDDRPRGTAVCLDDDVTH